MHFVATELVCINIKQERAAQHNRNFEPMPTLVYQARPSNSTAVRKGKPVTAASLEYCRTKQNCSNHSEAYQKQKEAETTKPRSTLICHAQFDQCIWHSQETHYV